MNELQFTLPEKELLVSDIVKELIRVVSQVGDDEVHCPTVLIDGEKITFDKFKVHNHYSENGFSILVFDERTFPQAKRLANLLYPEISSAVEKPFKIRVSSYYYKDEQYVLSDQYLNVSMAAVESEIKN